MNKKLFLLVLIILVSIGTISHASAVEDSTVIAQDNSSEIETQTVIDMDDADFQDESLSSDSSIIYLNSESNIQDAIDSAKAGDTIVLNGTFKIKDTINVNKAIKINGSDEGATISKDSISKLSLFNVNAVNVVLNNLKFYSGKNTFAGAILWNGNYGTINNCEFIDNIATGSSGGGAIVLTGDNCNINNCVFNTNKAITEASAGAIYVKSDFCQLVNCTFKNNEAIFDGGALVLEGESCIISNCTFERNEANYGNGGAILVTGDKNRILKSIFRENKVSNADNINSTGGGAIFCDSSNFLINNCSFYDNVVINGRGGAIVLLGDFNQVRSSRFFANTALTGRDIYGTPGSYLDYNFFSIRYDEDEEVSVYGCGAEIINQNTFNRTKVDSSVTFFSSMIFDYGATGSINLITDGCFVEEKNIRVLNHNAKITLVNNTLTVSGLDVGNYILRVTTTPDENHTKIDKDLNITVQKATAVITASKITVALKSGASWSIKLVNSKTNKPISGMVLTLKIYTGNKYITTTVRTNSNGIATYYTRNLAAGSHKIVVTGTHGGYKFNTVTSSIKVIKQTALRFKLSKRVNGNGGSLLSYFALNKKTGKGINGIKIKCMIYTGKKFKSYTLTTKKLKVRNKVVTGAFGFSTNDFSAGKHIVKLKPVSLKYKGSVSTYIVIKKAATKKLKFFRKV